MKHLACTLLTFTLCFNTVQAVSASTHKIYIDPGHYVGDNRTETEIETNLAVGLKLKELLENDTSSGITWKILMSRYNSDSRKGRLDDPTQRALDANDFGAHLFLSIHCNAGPTTATGTETFWCDRNIENGRYILDKNAEENEKFADIVQKHMAKRGDWHSRHDGLGHLDRDYPHFQETYPRFGGHLPILLYLKVPGCLNEIGFVTNESDKEKLLSDHWRNKFAEAYRDAIYEYFRLQLPTYLEITLAAGWNAISIPGIPVSSYPWSTIIQSDLLWTPGLYRWDPFDGWKQIQRVKFGEGYLIYSFDGREKVHISYLSEDEYTIDLERGYNMIGSVSHIADFSEARNRFLSRELWTWNPRNGLEEVPSDTITPGWAYFVKASRRTELTIRSDAQAAPTRVPENIPKETQLLANFPNPFNPETWIPYKLSKPAEVTMTIYTADGRLVRTLALGHKSAGIYQDKSRSAYWDGKNEYGEFVASGIYFYTLKTGEFAATRKMLILK